MSLFYYLFCTGNLGIGLETRNRKKFQDTTELDYRETMEAEKNVNSYWDNNGTSDGGSFQEEGGNITQDQENGTGTGFSASLDQNNIGQQHEQQGLLESVLWTFFPLSRSTLFLAAVIAMPWIYDFGTPWLRWESNSVDIFAGNK